MGSRLQSIGQDNSLAVCCQIPVPSVDKNGEFVVLFNRQVKDGFAPGIHCTWDADPVLCHSLAMIPRMVSAIEERQESVDAVSFSFRRHDSDTEVGRVQEIPFGEVRSFSSSRENRRVGESHFIPQRHNIGFCRAVVDRPGTLPSGIFVTVHGF
jgi:hypothetical protein